MKYPVHAALPAWHKWTDGRAFSPGETKRMRKLWKRCRNPGECPRHFFERVRPIIEAEMARRSAPSTYVPGVNPITGKADDEFSQALGVA